MDIVPIRNGWLTGHTPDGHIYMAHSVEAIVNAVNQTGDYKMNYEEK